MSAGSKPHSGSVSRISGGVRRIDCGIHGESLGWTCCPDCVRSLEEQVEALRTAERAALANFDSIAAAHLTKIRGANES